MTDEDTSDVEEGKLGNNNSVTHGLYQKRKNVLNHLDTEERKLLIDIATDLMDRVDGDVGAYERQAIQNIALDTLKRNRANDYIFEKGFEDSPQRIHEAYSRLVRDITSEMSDLGIKVKSPEDEAKEAEAGWFKAMQTVHDDEDFEE